MSTLDRGPEGRLWSDSATGPLCPRCSPPLLVRSCGSILVRPDALGERDPQLNHSSAALRVPLRGASGLTSRAIRLDEMTLHTIRNLRGIQFLAGALTMRKRQRYNLINDIHPGHPARRS